MNNQLNNNVPKREDISSDKEYELYEQKRREMDLQIDDLIAKARNPEQVEGVENSEESILEYRRAFLHKIVDFGNMGVYVCGKMNAADAEWIRPIAENGDIIAALCMLYGMRKKERCWYDSFKDEDTGEECTCLRSERVEGSAFPLDEELESSLCRLLCQQYKQMRSLYQRMFRYILKDVNIPKQLKIREELVKLGDTDSMEWFGDLYLYGKEEFGFFIDPEKAKGYYEMAGSDIDPYEYLADKEDTPSVFYYTIRGKETTLNNIAKMVDTLSQQYGMPNNEFGLYIPLEYLMHSLVGSKYYRGNVIKMRRESPESLFLHTESDSGEPLEYALLKAFPDVGIEVEEHSI